MNQTPEEFIEEKVRENLTKFGASASLDFQWFYKTLQEAIEFGEKKGEIEASESCWKHEKKAREEGAAEERLKHPIDDADIEEAMKEGAKEERAAILAAFPKRFEYPDMGQLGETVSAACNHVLNDIRSFIEKRNV